MHKKSQSLLAPLLYCIVVLIASWFTYMKNYDNPQALFWDENYHIAAATKYINGVYFQESHPPLGKLLIAVGEVMFGKNTKLDTTYFLETDHVKEVPKGYSFSGVRFFPALLGWLSVALFYLVLLNILGNPHVSFFGTLPMLFENGLIVHFRGAMLDGMQVFFVLLATLYFVFILKKEKPLSSIQYFTLGLLVSLSISIKVTSAVLLLLFPTLFWKEHPLKIFHLQPKKTLELILTRVPSSILGLLIPFFCIWYLHFSIAAEVHSKRNYNASPAMSSILVKKQTSHILNLPLMISEALAYSNDFNKGVRELKICSPDENGSSPLSWIVGAKTINYRWEKVDGGKVKYLYLVFNPVVVTLSIFGLICGAVLVLSHFIFDLPLKDKNQFSIIAMFLALWFAYMGAVYQIPRVMYLYHYFVPYLFSLLLTVTVFHYVFKEYYSRNTLVIALALILISAQIALTYSFFSPLTYYEPISAPEFHRRAWLVAWKMEPIL